MAAWSEKQLIKLFKANSLLLKNIVQLIENGEDELAEEQLKEVINLYDSYIEN